jgi:SAM-dependent methyltransferase
MKSSFDFDQNPTLTNNYDRGPRWFIPGYDASHAMAAVLLCDRIGEIGKILVIGAGGGIELTAFAREASGWSFTGVDPSAEMLSRARQKIDEAGATDRVSLVRGTAEDAPREAFDAATAFLALHFLPDDGARLRALREIHARLKHGAPFLMINGCTDMESPPFCRGPALIRCLRAPQRGARGDHRRSRAHAAGECSFAATRARGSTAGGSRFPRPAPLLRRHVGLWLDRIRLRADAASYRSL